MSAIYADRFPVPCFENHIKIGDSAAIPPRENVKKTAFGFEQGNPLLLGSHDHGQRFRGGIIHQQSRGNGCFGLFLTQGDKLRHQLVAIFQRFTASGR